jgi:hypothetical protein
MISPLVQIGGTLVVAAVLVAWAGPTVRWLLRPGKAYRIARRPEPRRPLQVVAADVRRLGRQIALVPAGSPVDRRRALAAAYEDALLEAALLLEVPNDLRTVPPGPARDAARLQLVADLEEAGLAVHA